jgi:hypothetical protein
MPTRKVFRFRYLDRATGTYRVSDDYATARAIAEIGAELLEDTVRVVDSGKVSSSGLLMRDRKRDPPP